MVLPLGATSFTEAMRMGSELYNHLKTIIKKKYAGDDRGSVLLDYVMIFTGELFVHDIFTNLILLFICRYY